LLLLFNKYLKTNTDINDQQTMNPKHCARLHPSRQRRAICLRWLGIVWVKTMDLTEAPKDNSVLDLRSYEEANLARLGLISIQERIPENYTTWTTEIERDGRVAKLKCVGASDYGGVPHGLDGDIATAIIDLYIESGAPENGEVLTSAYRLLKRAGLQDTGHYYAALGKSLTRLRFAAYTASEAWMDKTKKRWTNVTFNYFEGYNYTGEDHNEIGGGSELSIKLSEPIVKSIRAKFLKPLELEFLVSLQRPLTRALYRLLDGKRYEPVTLGGNEPLKTYSQSLVAWAQECKIVDQAPDRIRRTLQGAHEELIERGYLREVIYFGRGQAQTITYEFGSGDMPSSVPVELMRRLTKYGLKAKVANDLCQTHPPEELQARLERFETILASGFTPKSAPAFLMDVIRNKDGKYDSTSELFAGPISGSSKTNMAVIMTRELEQAEAEQARRLEEAEYQALSRTAKVERVFQDLRILTLHLTEIEREQLKARLLIQHSDPKEFKLKVLKLYADVGKDKALALLRDQT
jgi:plasmid replication initiation protein